MYSPSVVAGSFVMPGPLCFAPLCTSGALCFAPLCTFGASVIIPEYYPELE